MEQLLNQLMLTFLLIFSVLVVARLVVAKTAYSPILVIVILGLTIGHIATTVGVVTPGIPELPLLGMMGRLATIALIASFFMGGQLWRRFLAGQKIEIPVLAEPSKTILVGTSQTQLALLLGAFFILLCIESFRQVIMGTASDGNSGLYLLAYLGLAGAIISADYGTIKDKNKLYIYRGLVEIAGLLVIMLAAHHLFGWFHVNVGIFFPPIFFAVLISTLLGFLLPHWKTGSTLKAMLFAGIPMVLGGTFLVGGTMITGAFRLFEVYGPVLIFGYFGHIFWMFGGLALLIFFGRANHIRNLAPGIAGSLSHAGLTGASTAGEMGTVAQARATIMIQLPFVCHLVMFPILAISVARGYLLVPWVVLFTVIGIGLTILSLHTLRQAKERDKVEFKGLTQFVLGWHLTVFFGSLLLTARIGMTLPDIAMATSAALSHFGLFAAIGEGMFGMEAAAMISFFFAMSFLVHPFVFGIFGWGMARGMVLPTKPVYLLAFIGAILMIKIIVTGRVLW